MKPESCLGCPLYNAPGPVWGTGHPSAKLIILGQNPGEQEWRDGIPFVGASGKVLDRALGNVGISRGANFVSNIVKCFTPPGTPPPQQAITQCRPLLEKELATLPHAKTILTLGQEAFHALTGKTLSIVHNRKSAEKHRESWLRGCPFPLGDGRVVIPAVHPSFVMRTGFNESPLFEVDLLRARRFSEGEATIPEERLNFNPTDHEVQEYVDRCRTKGECGLDIETPETAVDEDDLDPLTQTPIELVGLSCDIGEAIGVRPDQFDLLRPLLEGPNERKVVCWAYNGGFDFYHLRKRYSLAGLKLADAMLSLHLLWPHLRTKDLATCLSIFTDLPYYKNLRKIEPDVYNARDTYGVLWAGQQSLQMLRNYGMESLFWNHMMPLIWVVDDWRVKGINTDQEEANRQILTLTMALNAYDKWWAENIPLVSWSSPKQLLGLFSAQGLPIQKKKRLQGPPTPSVDDDVLEMYVKKYKSQTALLVQMMRGLKHARDFYEMADEDGKIHARFKLHGQVGGRIQSVGANVQTIPEELDVANGSVYPRNIICPDNPEEDVIISADFSQIELWCYAWYSKDKNLLEVKESGDYVYGAFYEDIFEEPFFIEAKPRTKENAYPDVAPYKLLIAKSWPLGFIYGRGVPNPEDQGLPITRSKAKEIHNSFHHRYPQISIFHADLMYKASKQGYLQTVFGRLRRFPNPRSLRNEILAFPGQSTAVDILISKALLPFKDLTRFGPRTRTLFSVHDSVQVNAHKSNAVEVAQFMKATMESPIPEMGGFHIPVTIKLGPNWGQCTLLQKYAQTTAGTTPDLPPAA